MYIDMHELCTCTVYYMSNHVHVHVTLSLPPPFSLFFSLSLSLFPSSVLQSVPPFIYMCSSHSHHQSPDSLLLQHLLLLSLLSLYHGVVTEHGLAQPVDFSLVVAMELLEVASVLKNTA